MNHKGSAGTDRQRHTEFTNKNVRSHQGTQQRIKTYWIYERCNPLSSLRFIFVSHTAKYTHLYRYTQTHHNKTFSCSLFCAHSTNVLISRWKNYQSVEELLLLILLLNQEKWLWNRCFNFVWFSKWLVMWKILV